MNIAKTLGDVEKSSGERTAVIEARSGQSVSFSELYLQSRQYASMLTSMGIVPGDRVMLMVRPSALFIALTFSLFRIGAPIILIDPGMGFRNVLRCIATVKPKYLIGIPQIIFLSLFFRKAFHSLKKRVSTNYWPGMKLFDCDKINPLHNPEDHDLFEPDDDSLAAIIFTTGSTGPPKGVSYEHRIFASQLKHIGSYYGVRSGDIDQPGFPLFGLFSTALGATAVIPDMDPTRPAQVDPKKFVESINRYQVTYSFGSPAIWNVVSSYCLSLGITCPSLGKVLMAGAPVSGELVKRVKRMISPGGYVFTPYGATESLPIVSIEGDEIINDTWMKTKNGHGTCVGKPLPGISVKVVASSEDAFPSISACREIRQGEIGEIIVSGDVVTRTYDNNERETTFSKIPDGTGYWHRMGDVGYFDEVGRLWFCGRKTHRVHTRNGVLYTIPCEAIANDHPDVFRSALVGIATRDGFELPAVVIELQKNCRKRKKQVIQEVGRLLKQHQLTRAIDIVLVHPEFPVDIRHNAKIFREKLKVWAAQKMKKGA